MGCGTERRRLSQYSSAVPGAALHDGMLQDAQAVYGAAGINRPPHGDDASSLYASHCRAIAGGPCTRSRIRGRRQGALARTQREAPDTRLGGPRIRGELIQRRRFSALHARQHAAPNGGDLAWRIRPQDQAAPRRPAVQRNPGKAQRRDQTEWKVRAGRSQCGKPHFRGKKSTMLACHDWAKPSVALALSTG